MKTFKKYLSEQAMRPSDSVDHIQKFKEDMLKTVEEIYIQSIDSSLEKALRSNFKVKKFETTDESTGHTGISYFPHNWKATLDDDTIILIDTNTTGYKFRFQINRNVHHTNKATIKTLISAIKKDLKGLNKWKLSNST